MTTSDRDKIETTWRDVARGIQGAMYVAAEFPGQVAVSKTTVRYALVDPVLCSLGWRTHQPAECFPDFPLGQRGQVDYALFDRQGDVAVLIEVGATYARRGQDRNRLAGRLRGMTRGMAALTYGSYWEIYDPSIRLRRFDDKRVEELTLDLEPPEHLERVARALHGWLGREQRW